MSRVREREPCHDEQMSTPMPAPQPTAQPQPDDKKLIRFHFDFVSPYAYIAWTQIHALAARYGCEVDPVPTLFAALLESGGPGTRGPAEIPAKRIYLFKDTLRTARVLGIPFLPPVSHPFNPLLALRVASLDLSKEERRRVIDTLYAAIWGGGQGADSAEKVAPLLTAAGFDGPALVAAAGTPAIKERLRAQTEAAIQAGVFGVPTQRIGGELFWGYDSFGHLERFLRGQDPLAAEPEDLLARWRALPASAQRRMV